MRHGPCCESRNATLALGYRCGRTPGSSTRSSVYHRLAPSVALSALLEPRNQVPSTELTLVVAATGDVRPSGQLKRQAGQTLLRVANLFQLVSTIPVSCQRSQSTVQQLQHGLTLRTTGLDNFHHAWLTAQTFTYEIQRSDLVFQLCRAIAVVRMNMDICFMAIIGDWPMQQELKEALADRVDFPAWTGQLVILFVHSGKLDMEMQSVFLD